MRILFACGGTAGHVNPALAVASLVRRDFPDAEILFAGNPDGMESRLVPESGFAFVPFRSMGIQRKLSWANFRRNCESLGLFLTSRSRAKRILEAFRPDVVFGTGSYVSAPVLLEACRLRIRTMTHEANALPGVSNRMVARKVSRFLVAVPEALEKLPPRPDYVLTGNPVRPEILTADRKAARRKLGIPDGLACLVSFGGSLGAEALNRAVAELMAWHSKSAVPVHHIHATGSYGTDWFRSLLEERGAAFRGNPRLDIREYIRDMPECLAAADLVISRAGAMTLAELEAAGRASVLIPSPNVAENHQYHNAMALAEHGAALCIEEKDLTGERLIGAVSRLLEEPSALRKLGEAAKRLAVPDAGERILRELVSLAGA